MATLPAYVSCPEPICWASTDQGQLLEDGSYRCTHCGNDLPATEVADWLSGLISDHERELVRIRTLYHDAVARDRLREAL